jgi:futalosine hydrolase
MEIILGAATALELHFLKKLLKKDSFNHKIHFVIHGIGGGIASHYITAAFLNHPNALFIQVGLAGSLNNSLALGETVLVQQEIFGDIGVIEQNKWKDLNALGLLGLQPKPFAKYLTIENKNIKYWKTYFSDTALVNGVTVNQITSAINSAPYYSKKMSATIETMEGASLHSCGNALQKKYLQIRGISNFVGDRNKKNWVIQPTIENYSFIVHQFLRMIKP